VPITVRSLEARHSLHYQFSGRITADDFDQAAAAEAPYFDALQPGECLNLIVNLSALETISPDLFGRLKQMRLFASDRVCWVVMVGANPYLRALVISLGVLNQQRRFTFQDRFDEGLRAMGLPSNGH